MDSQTRHLLVRATPSDQSKAFLMSSDGLIATGLFEDLQNKIDDDGKIKDVSIDFGSNLILQTSLQ